MPIVLSLSSLRPAPLAPDLLFPSASDLWFRALPRAFLCRFTKLFLVKWSKTQVEE